MCFFEELGWTGFAIPRLKRRYGVLITGLIVGVLWSAWHVLVVAWGIGDRAGTIPVRLFIIVDGLAGLPAFRVLMVWIYDRTESLFVAMLMHVSLTACTLIFTPQTTGPFLLAYGLAFAAVVWGAVVAFAVMRDRTCSRSVRDPGLARRRGRAGRHVFSRPLMTRRQLALVVPTLLTLHNLEEALTFQRWWHVILTRVPIGLQPCVEDVSPGALQVALVVVTAVPWAIALWSAHRASSRVATWFVLLVQAVVLLNALWHLLVAGFVLQGYSPGLLTAATLNLPFSMYLFSRATREGWCSPRAAIALIPAAVFVHGPLLVGLIYLTVRII